jgi:hypothetical protein
MICYWLSIVWTYELLLFELFHTFQAECVTTLHHDDGLVIAIVKVFQAYFTIKIHFYIRAWEIRLMFLICLKFKMVTKVFKKKKLIS